MLAHILPCDLEMLLISAVVGVVVAAISRMKQWAASVVASKNSRKKTVTATNQGPNGQKS